MNKYIKYYKNMVFLALIGVPIGICVGIIDTIFGKTLLYLTDVRNNYFLYLIPFLPIIGVVIVYLYNKFGKNCSNGMGLVFQVGHKKEDNIPLRLIPFIILSTWATHLFGGSAGREGVAVQIGATFSNWFGKKLGLKKYREILIITGMSAGFAGLFQTPIAAILFALEVLVVGKINFRALLPAIIASFISSFVSHYLGLEKFTFNLQSLVSFDAETILKLIILGIIFGIIGGLFAILLKYSKQTFNKIFKNPFLKILLVSIVLAILLVLLHKGRYSGLGTNLISFSFENKEIFYYDWILKSLFTIITLSIGFQGGEVTPLFSIGASLGVVLASIFNLPIEFVASLGYISVFGAATNTFFAPIFIGAEIFGYNYMPYYFICVSFSYIFNFNKSIYTLQKIR